MPLPLKGESQKDYITRFMSDPAMKKKYPNEKQRFAVALSHWADRFKKQIILQKIDNIKFILKADKYDRMAQKLSNLLMGSWDQQSKDAINDLIRGIVGSGKYKKTGKLTKTEINKRLKELSQMMGKDIISLMRNPINEYTQNIYTGELTDIAGTGTAFDLIDEKAIAWTRENTMYWMGNHYGDHVSEKIGKLAGQVLKEGMDRKTAAAFFKKRLGKEFKKSKYYWDLIANHVVTRSREFGRTAAYQKAEIEYIRIVATIDHRTSAICRELNGKTFPVAWNIKLRDKLINSKDPEDAKKIAPWLNDKQIEQKIIGKKPKDLPKWVGMPPYHGKCRTRTVRSSEAQWLQQNATPAETKPPTKPTSQVFTKETDADRAMKKYVKTLSNDELEILKEYTAVRYQNINQAMRSGKINAKIQKEIDTLQRILIKAPKINKNVTRGVSFGNQPAADKFLQSISSGDIITNNTFWSTSTRQNIAEGFFEKKINILFDIKPKNGGSWVDGASYMPHEKEVLFNPNSRFKILGKEIKTDRFGEKFTKISLEEI